MKQKRLNDKLISTLTSVLYMPTIDLREKSGITRSTWYELMARPETITVQQLLGIANGLHIPVSKFFSDGRADLIGQRDDYVTEPYIKCYYDNEALREIVSKRQDATWKRAAEITGMTYQHLQKSLMAETRTPVARLLKVCEAFAVDPFAILVDPNPKRKGKRRKRTDNAGDEDELRKEIFDLREDFQRLSETVSGLKGKYEQLLKEHERLAARLSMSINSINSSCIGIATDPMPEDK